MGSKKEGRKRSRAKMMRCKGLKGVERIEEKRRRLEATTTSTSTASISATQVYGISGEGGPTAGESALTGPSPTVVDSPLVPPELDLPGPSSSTPEEEDPPSASEEEEDALPLASEEEEDAPPSATQRKLGSLGVKGNLGGEELQGNRVLDISTVASTIETGSVCSICHSKLKVCESFKNRRGMVARITSKWTNKHCKNVKFLSDPRSQKTTTLNKTAVLAGRSAGLGRRGLQTITASLDLLPPITGRAYSEHNKQIAKDIGPVTQNMLKEACNRVHDFYEKPHDQILDVGVSVDGTWMTRSFMSKFGVTAANSCETGEVLDFEIMCRVCELCKAYKINHTQQEFNNWWAIHKNSAECQINHTENSGLMESAAAVIIFKRSEQKSKLRFTSMLGDGDTKTIASINEAKPYGAGVVVKKEECIGHVAKRFYKRLERVRCKRVKNPKGVVATIKGASGLTKENLATICRYYRGAILSNTDNVDGMIRDIQAVFHHCSSTDEKPQHSFCPKGWCKFNKYEQEKAKNPNTNMPVPKHRTKPLIPPFYARYFKKSFDKVCRRELLEKCKRGATQNTNERFHSVIWGMASKNKWCSLTTVRIAVSLAIAKYNLGFSAGLSRCLTAVTGQAASKRVMASFTGLDADSMDHSARRNSEIHKKRRTYLALLRTRQEEASIEAGGVSYVPALAEEITDEEESSEEEEGRSRRGRRGGEEQGKRKEGGVGGGGVVVGGGEE